MLFDLRCKHDRSLRGRAAELFGHVRDEFFHGQSFESFESFEKHKEKL